MPQLYTRFNVIVYSQNGNTKSNTQRQQMVQHVGQYGFYR